MLLPSTATLEEPSREKTWPEIVAWLPRAIVAVPTTRPPPGA